MGREIQISPEFLQRIEQLNTIGISLSAERDSAYLLEKILLGAKSITNADGGTLYVMDGQRQLRFEIMRTDSLDIALGGSSGKKISLEPIALYNQKGEPNIKTVAAFAAIKGETVNIPDIYQATGFDFSGTKRYDEQTGYQSKSFLTVPMLNHEREVIGVLQLINARDRITGETVGFCYEDQRLTQSLASQAAVALSNQFLLQDVKGLLEKFIEVIASAIDEKSPYTGGHCRRVPLIAMLIAEAIHEVDCGPLEAAKFSEAQFYELRIAALLHDCGKITTPVHIVDKATKLEAIYDRMQHVDLRFELMKRDVEMSYLKERLQRLEGKPPEVDSVVTDKIACLTEQQDFLRHCNLGSEHMPAEAQQKIAQIARQHWQYNGEQYPLLSEDEIYHLSIVKGTLTPEERAVINNHIVRSIKMLESLPFPKHLQNVPEIAGGHHERMDGKGYPRGLTRNQMSLQARLMGIADIFEALTAADRPYKKAMTLSQALRIMGQMKLDHHIDPDIFDVFIHQRVYLKYAGEFLSEKQIDDIDFESLPGYQALE